MNEPSLMQSESGIHFCPRCLAVFRRSFARCPLDGAALQTIAEGGDPLIGMTLAERYIIEACVGEGGMGRVYRARHQRMSRLFAVKVIYGDLAADTKMRTRFAREADAASRLSHPNVISVVDFGETAQSLLYLVMDFVSGPKLSSLIYSHAPFEASRVAAFIYNLAAGLEHAHGKGLIHRDFKPDNVLISLEDGAEMPKIVDFGIAQLLEANRDKLTTEGMVMGTPAYMSPEQAIGQELDHRTDLYSLGVVGYEMLSGVTPFDGVGPAVLRQAIALDPPPIHKRVPGLVVDPKLEAITHRLMAKQANMRFQSAAEIMEAVAAWQEENVAASGRVAALRALSNPGRKSTGNSGEAWDRVSMGMLPTESTATASATAEVPPHRSRLFLIVGVAVAMIFGVVLGLILLGRGGDESADSKPGVQSDAASAGAARPADTAANSHVMDPSPGVQVEALQPQTSPGDKAPLSGQDNPGAGDNTTDSQAGNSKPENGGGTTDKSGGDATDNGEKRPQGQGGTTAGETIDPLPSRPVQAPKTISPEMYAQRYQEVAAKLDKVATGNEDRADVKAVSAEFNKFEYIVRDTEKRELAYRELGKLLRKINKMQRDRK